MPATLIHIVNGNWTAEVANTSISYTFKGATLSAQRTSVNEFSGNTFRNGMDEMNTFFETSDSETFVAQQLFSTTDSLIYKSDTIFTISESSGPEIPALIDCLEDVGEALLMAI